MASIHDQLIGSAAELVSEAMGEPAGDAAACEYFAPDQQQGQQLTGVILFNRRANVDFDPAEGGMTRNSMTAIKVRTAQLAAIGVRGPQEKAFVRLPDGDWAVDVTNTVWGETWVKLGLKRTVNAGFEDRRSADS